MLIRVSLSHVSMQGIANDPVHNLSKHITQASAIFYTSNMLTLLRELDPSSLTLIPQRQKFHRLQCMFMLIRKLTMLLKHMLLVSFKCLMNKVIVLPFSLISTYAMLQRLGKTCF